MRLFIKQKSQNNIIRETLNSNYNNNNTAIMQGIYIRDIIGIENIIKKVFIENNENFVIKRIENYKIEEKIYDWQLNKRITFNEFLNFYFGNNTMKSVSTLHNKLVIQEDEKFSLFSLKNIEDSNRLLNTLESYMINNEKNESILVRDVSTTQRKWIYDVLVKNGFNRKRLYRQTTTFSKRN
jgi:hypothetical protein